MRITTPIVGNPNDGETNQHPDKPQASYVRATTNDPNPPTNLRNGPGSNYETVARIQEGEIFLVDLRGSGEWLPVKTSDNKYCYIHRPIIRVVK